MLINAYATHTAPPPLEFPHTPRAYRDWRDPELREHLRGLQGYVEEPGVEPDDLTVAIVDHVQRVRTHTAFETGEENFAAVTDWALAANALLFFPDSSLRDPNFRVLFDPHLPGPDPDAFVPQFPHGEERKQRTTASLELAEIPVNRGLPVIAPDPEVVPQAVSDVIDRLCSLLVVAVRAESLSEGNPISVQQLRGHLPRAFSGLTTKEEAFLAHDAPPQQDLVNALWRYECVPVLLWAVGLIDHLEFPQQVCDVPAITDLVLSADFDSLDLAGHLRPVSELLDEVDLMYRLHWAIRDRELNGQESLPGVQPGVVMERRNALEWLVDTATAWDNRLLTT
ncbi:MAG: DUF4272 domain-containing protein [Acidimicrobiales bacterium]|nr:DUF4272 domain-containing protein [Acidimicrobiales bacterium]